MGEDKTGAKISLFTVILFVYVYHQEFKYINYKVLDISFLSYNEEELTESVNMK